MKAVMVVVGTRPEIIKAAPVVRALQKNRISLFSSIAGNIMTTTCPSSLLINLNSQFQIMGTKSRLARKGYKPHG